MSNISLSNPQDTPILDANAAEERRAELRKKAGRFRILVIGKPNAGKTTILKKICNTTDDAEIYNGRGKKESGLSNQYSEYC
jgi:ribosome biogenesis GTPase A